MALALRDIAVAFSIDVDDQSVTAAENAIKGIKSMASKLLGAIGIGFSIAGISNLAEAAAEAEALKSQFSQVFGDVEQDAADKLDKIASDTGVAVNRMKGSFTQIAAFAKTTGMEQADALDIADRSMQAVADSAAFYDRSIEDVTNSLQSFLKGNFENDAALGLSCTETTRNAAANALYGKSFTDLSEAEKQLTLLQMVEDANKASGAIGQAARESDTWTNQLGNLKQNLQDLKAAAGNGFLQPAVMVLKLLNSLTQKATAGMQKLTSETGLVTKAFNSLYSLVKRLKPAIDRMMQTLQVGANKGASMIKAVINKLGGVDNALKLLAIVAGAFLIAMNWERITKGAAKFLSLLSKIKGLFTMANLKTLAIVAAVVLLALIVEDFINFLLGNDSLIGTIFDKAGIGADNARQAIFDAFTKTKEFLLNVWDTLKEAAAMFADSVKGFFEKHGEDIQQTFGRAWDIIKTILNGAWTFITQLAATLFGSTEDEIDGSQTSTKDKILSIWQSILDTLSAVFDIIFDTVDTVFNAIATVIEVVLNVIKVFWDNWGSTILDYWKVLWDSIGGIINGFLEVIQGIANFISSVFTGDWQGAWDAIKTIFEGVLDIIVNLATAQWEAIKLIFSMALAAIKAVWEVVWGAISSFFEGLWNGIVSFITGIWDTITGVITGAINGAHDVISSVLSSISDFFSNIWNGIVSVVSGVWDTITGVVSGAINGVYNTVSSVLSSISSFFSDIFSGIASVVSNTFDNMLSGVSGFIGNIKDSIVDGLTSAIDWIRELPGQALQWGSDIIDGIVDGIRGAISKVTDAVSGVADKIKSFLHFSVPDEGPLTDYQSWMPDFMGGLASGISASEDTVLDKVKDVAGGISTLMQGATASAATAASSQINNTTSNMTQNVNINNSYSGGSTDVQKNVSRAMNKSAVDATTQMARGLAYARG